jgi:hypothetical protein
MGVDGYPVEDVYLAAPAVSHDPALAPNVDYRIHLPANAPLHRALQIRGGHNVTIIGGEVELIVPGTDDDASSRGIYISKPSPGAVYIEGVHIKNPQYPDAISADTSDGIVVDNPSSAPSDITIQNVRIDGISGLHGNHSDIIQTWYAGNAKVHVDRLTGSSNCQGLQIDPDLAWQNEGTYPTEFVIKNTNLRVLGSRNRYLAWLTYGLGCNSGPIVLDNVWIDEPDGTLGLESVWPDTDQPAGGESLWDPGSGTLSFPREPQIQGVIHAGVPPGGDFVPLGVAGIDYVSPGYAS